MKSDSQHNESVIGSRAGRFLPSKPRPIVLSVATIFGNDSVALASITLCKLTFAFSRFAVIRFRKSSGKRYTL